MNNHKLLWLLVKIELDDPLEMVGVKLVRQAGARTNDLAGDGCTTSIILARGLITEGVKVRILHKNRADFPYSDIQPQKLLVRSLQQA